MKFGKRLGAEAARRWRPFYLDYKAIKRAIRTDVAEQDRAGSQFDRVIKQELQKISTFYVEKEEELEAMLASMAGRPTASMAQFCAEVQDLRKFAVLNYIAVIKAIKKRNRHLRQRCGPAAVAPLRAVDLLSHQYFFTSTKLAALSTQAEVLAKERLQLPSPREVLQEYECPICLSILHSPVVLTCAHRFCWGCLITHCAATATNQGLARLDADLASDMWGGGGMKGRPAEVVAEESDASAVATYDCPVCRKAQILDLDRLQVDPHLTRFIEDLKLRDDSDPSQRMQDTQPTNLEAPTQLTPASFSIAAASTVKLAEIAASPSGSAAEAAMELPKATAAAVDVPARKRRSNDGFVEDEAACTHQSDIFEDCVSTPASEQRGLLAEAADADELAADTMEDMEVDTAAAVEDPPLLPPQPPHYKGKLTVVLDLDGTLVSSYTPKRAPRMPPTMHTYIVGCGGNLNPSGVFVVERPGLHDFFSELSKFAEVVLFTAGLEEYAAPIADMLEQRYTCFDKRRLYRPATTASDVYPCIKDLSRLGRDLGRTVLVDDTPLAFLHQPDNGIPIYNFRGDVDDRLLMEAVLPLLQQLSGCADVRPTLRTRFNMPRWFRAQGVALNNPKSAARPPLPPAKLKADVPVVSVEVKASARSMSSGDLMQLSRSRQAPSLLLCDFDKTLTDCDAGERLVGELAPELAPMLAALEMPANFVPVTNAVLSEMQRRGIPRDLILSTLRKMGTEMPYASIKMVQWAFKRGIKVQILSDCNTVFINHMLTGAKINTLIHDVTTNFASFERVECSGEAQEPGLMLQSTTGRKPAAKAAADACHKLVITPRLDYSSASHGCPLCPANLCKGRELRALREAGAYQRVVYCGDGANDLCPALALGPGDHVLARRGHALERLIGERQEDGFRGARVTASIATWANHAELFKLVEDIFC